MSKQLSMEPMAIYMREISRYALLTAEEDVELSKRIAAGDDEARTFMIQSNLRLVVKIARRFLHRGLALGDLIEEGNMGLMRAVEKFDASHGCRFSTYATWWIRQAVERAIMNQARTIRLPVHIAKEYNQVLACMNKLRNETGREPTEAEIAAKMGLSLKKVRLLLETTLSAESPDTAIGDDGEFSIYEVTADESAEAPSDRLAGDRRNEILECWMQQLSKKEREVVRLRYGIGLDDAWTLEEVGEHLGVTRERIRQIQVTALKKPRAMVENDNIRFEEIL